MSYLLVEMPLLLAQIDSEALDDDNPVWEGWGSVIFVTALLALIVVLIIAVLWFVRSINSTKALASRDQAFQKLAEQSTSAQEQIAEEQRRAADELAEMKTRIANIERILSEVE
jgi:hypothetical protein